LKKWATRIAKSNQSFRLAKVNGKVIMKMSNATDIQHSRSEIVLHQPSGILYLACSTPQSRSQWSPVLLLLNASGRSQEDYVATYDPQNSRITRLAVSGLPQGLSLHGMDVVPSASNHKELFVYLVNHQPFVDKDPQKFGANSTIEIFKTKIGGSTLTHLHTVYNPVILSPNDIVGSPDGKSFYFTNDAGAKTGLVRHL
jgi:arylesterase/paraoxonase